MNWKFLLFIILFIIIAAVIDISIINSDMPDWLKYILLAGGSAHH